MQLNNLMSKINSKRIILALLFVLSFCFQLFADDIFDELVSILSNDPTKRDIIAISQKYQKERIEGRGYVTSMTRGVDGNLIINIYTKKSRDIPGGAYVSASLSGHFAQRALKNLKIGRNVRVFGEFQEIRYNTIIIEKALVK